MPVPTRTEAGTGSLVVPNTTTVRPLTAATSVSSPTARNRLVIWLVTSSSCCVVTDERTGTNVATRCCDGPFD